MYILIVWSEENLPYRLYKGVLRFVSLSLSAPGRGREVEEKRRGEERTIAAAQLHKSRTYTRHVSIILIIPFVSLGEGHGYVSSVLLVDSLVDLITRIVKCVITRHFSQGQGRV